MTADFIQDFSSWWNIISGIVILLVGGGVGHYATKLVKVSTLRKAFDDLQRVNTADKERMSLIEKGLDDLKAEVIRLTAENVTLKGLVTSAAKVDDLAKQITSNHGEVMTTLQTIATK